MRARRLFEGIAIIVGVQIAAGWLLDHDTRLRDLEERVDGIDKAASADVELALVEEPAGATRVSANGSAGAVERVGEQAPGS